MARQPAAFVWAGDAIYADDFEYPPTYDNRSWIDWFFTKKKVKQATPATFQELFRAQLQHPGYRAFLGHKHPYIMGTFDDHDYGLNNGDRTYQYKRESAIAYMDFIAQSNQQSQQQAEDAWMTMKERAAQGKGLYGVKVLDFLRPAGQQLLTDAEAGLDPTVVRTSEYERVRLSNRSVAIFLLDSRSNKTPWVEKNETMKFKSELKYDGDFLGEEQWTWFEQAIGSSTAAVNFVVQGLQVHPERYFDGHLIENWSRFPMAQHRLYQALLKSNVQAPILISGDVHMSQVMRRDCRRVQNGSTSPNTRFLLELTTSGMTHSWGHQLCERPTDSELCKVESIQKSLSMGMHAVHHSGAWPELVTLDHAEEGARKGVQYTLERSFGEFEFDWERRQVRMRVLGGDSTKPPYLSTVWDFDTLSGRSPVNETGLVTSAEYSMTFEHLASHNISNSNDWVCVSYRGHASEERQLLGIAIVAGVGIFLLLLPVVSPVLLAFILIRSKRRKQA